MGFPTTLLIPKLNISLIKIKQHNIDNILNQKQSIKLNNKNQFHSNHKVDEHILKKPYPKKWFSQPTLSKK